MKRLLLLILVLSLVVAFVACSGNATQPIPNNDLTNDPPTATPVLDLTTSYTTSLPAANGITNFVQFTMQGGATFVVELYPDIAPETVKNFQRLVYASFYDGLTFHRIYKDFMIQGGDPKGDGTGSSRVQIKGEFSSNGYTGNTLAHERGVISMARKTDPDSASCQFFIMHQDTPSLNGNYAAFGRVVAGMETIDTIAALEVTEQKYSTEKTKPVRVPVIESAYFVEYTPQAPTT